MSITIVPGTGADEMGRIQGLGDSLGAFSTWLRQGRDIPCYFDNDEAGYAVQNALELRRMFAGDGK